MYKEKILDITTNEESWRDYSLAEIAKVEKAQADAAVRIAEQAEKDAARKSILDKLGLSEDEARLLLGGN